MMRRRGREDGFGLAEAAVDIFKPPQEARHRAGTDGDVLQPSVVVLKVDSARGFLSESSEIRSVT
jgi:hypothetical protein